LAAERPKHAHLAPERTMGSAIHTAGLDVDYPAPHHPTTVLSGLDLDVRSDNSLPFAFPKGPYNLSGLSVFWLRLGIADLRGNRLS
jgi:hypothetical protein